MSLTVQQQTCMHIDGLAKAIETDDEKLGVFHLVAIGKIAICALIGIGENLERIAENTTPEVIKGSTTGGGLGES